MIVIKSLIKKRFNKLLVTEKTSKRTTKGEVIWKCQCDCGKTKEVSTSMLTSNRTNHCGCSPKKYSRKNPKLIRVDLTGKHFGKLWVICPTFEYNKDNKMYWETLCSCGNIFIENSKNIKEGKQHCGCQGGRHGLKNHSLYPLWKGIRARCKNPKHPAYPNYGGRGIKICNRWNNFANFLEDMGEKPQLDYSVDRIDPNGNYEPDNCRWADVQTQAINRTNNTSGCVGVQFDKQSFKWDTTIVSKTKKYNLGSYNTIQDAIEARRQGEITYWGKEYQDFESILKSIK